MPTRNSLASFYLARSCLIGAILIALGALGACLDNPHGRAATIVDGSLFPPDIRGVLLPSPGYTGGAAADIYLFGPAAPDLSDAGRAIVLIDAQGDPLPACRTGERDAEGQRIDVDLDACQGPILPTLPSTERYTPFVRVLEAVVPDDYRPNQARSADELSTLGIATADSGRVGAFAIIDSSATLIDPAERISRNFGWYQTLQAAYLDLGDQLVVTGDEVQAMDLLVPQGQLPGAPGTVVQARADDDGYSTLCRVIYFQTPGDFQPGDYTDAADVPALDRLPPDPAEYLLCAVP